MPWGLLEDPRFLGSGFREKIRLVVIAAGGIVREVLSQSGGASGFKDDDQRITAADGTADRWLVSSLTAAYPDSAGYSEESGRFGPGEADLFWLIDPLDGTRSSTHGGLYAVSVGLVAFCDGEPVAGAGWVYVPNSGLMFEGLISTEACACLRNECAARINAPVGGGRKNYLVVNSDWRSELVPRWTGRITAPGATAVHLCLLVDPYSDATGVALTRYKPYDAAAGLVVAAAGGAAVRPIADGSETPLSTAGLLRLLHAYTAHPGEPGPDMIVGHPGCPMLFS